VGLDPYLWSAIGAYERTILAMADLASQSWYYCADPSGYYPYIAAVQYIVADRPGPNEAVGTNRSHSTRPGEATLVLACEPQVAPWTAADKRGAARPCGRN